MVFDEDIDRPLLDWLWKGELLLGIALLLISKFTTLRIPYGRYGNDSGWRGLLAFVKACKLPARMAWFLQELPAFLIPMILILNVGGRYVDGLNPNIVLLGMFLIHYFNRVFIFPLSIRGNPTPILPMIVAIFFCMINGYIQGRYLTNYIHYDISWFWDPRFITGHILFLLGMAINIHSDTVLRGLRKPGETGYKIPYGGMFDYVSGANYFGESLEWAGYAIACWNIPATAFALFTSMFIGSRAFQHHNFYLSKFEDYPKHRKAFIPFVM